MDSGTTNGLSGVWGSCSHDVFAAGSRGTILHYDGVRWRAMSSGTANDLYGVWGSGGSDVFAVAWGGTILHYGGNQPPVAALDHYATFTNRRLSVAAPGVLGNDQDPDGDPLTAMLEGLPLSGTLALNLNGSFSYTPTLDFEGVDRFTYRATDGISDSNVATVTLTVAEPVGIIHLPLVMRQ